MFPEDQIPLTTSIPETDSNFHGLRTAVSSILQWEPTVVGIPRTGQHTVVPQGLLGETSQGPQSVYSPP